MPFKSKKQETWFRINEPKIWKEWVKSYGHFQKSDKVANLQKNKQLIKDLAKTYYEALTELN